jgi:hypothetical protein
VDLRVGLDVLEKGEILPMAGFEPHVKILCFRSSLKKKGEKEPSLCIPSDGRVWGNTGCHLPCS